MYKIRLEWRGREQHISVYLRMPIYLLFEFDSIVLSASSKSQNSHGNTELSAAGQDLPSVNYSAKVGDGRLQLVLRSALLL